MWGGVVEAEEAGLAAPRLVLLRTAPDIIIDKVR